MSSIIPKQELEQLRREYRTYLKQTHPDWSESTVSLHSSDAFYAYNNNIGIDFWYCFTSEEALLNAKDKIKEYIASEKNPERAVERANGYYISMKHFKAFLDSKHPGLASDWSGKSVSDTYLKSKFQDWMKLQKKSDGQPYKLSTITAYTTALKNATEKLNLGDTVHTDLFYYTTPEEFAEARDIILNAPNFEEVDLAAGNKSYSNGIKLYAKFLDQLGKPSCWVFQGNPKYYDLVSAISDLDSITWAVNQYKNQIKKNDKAYIWMSGSEGGIIATGRVICDPEMREYNRSDPYIREELSKSETYLAVDIKIERILIDSIVPRTLLLADERTKRLEILTYPGATNFRVTNEQEEVIESIINGTYVRQPASTDVKPVVTEKRKYWMFAPGEGSSMWDEFYSKGIMGINWDELGDLKKYDTKEAMKAQMRVLYGEQHSYKNAGHATWQFANEIKPGDIVFAKKGLNKIIGRGIVASDYIFDDSRTEYKHIHKVEWTHRGEWEQDGQTALKTLTDITPYTEYYRRLEEMITMTPGDETDNAVQFESYTKDDFLNEVYMSEDRYNTLVGLLKRKKNIILQGAPGVGKTFAAIRLAYSIMGEKDTNRVKVVQFHQSYSYEDFIMGYRPAGNGFALKTGPFYNFCKEAESEDKEYFFIIDEINRGNLSKIFGELLMLIEHDKRGENHSLQLVYSGEQFYVPENVHIIGMMNTADRSLAMIDYALRRRFAFFEFEPAFDQEGFKTYQAAIANRKFDTLIETVCSLNRAISEDPSLGSGFRIGHSYFCTNDVVTDEWLMDVVEYELVPLINEYWFDEPAKIDQWTKRLRGAVHG